MVLAVASLGACGGEGARREVDPGFTSTVVEAGQAGGRGGETRPGGTTAEAQEPPPGMARCLSEEEEVRVGSFEKPEDVPPYTVLQKELVEQGCVEAVRLLVDTRATDKAGYVSIARDIKAEYEQLDAVSVEFTDTSGAFSYEGSALIFNTSSGAFFIGYAYGPPNDDGYYVTVSK